MSQYNLTEGSIAHHIRHLSIPASIGMFFNTMYNVVDTFYAGQISTEALAGMTISFPIFFIILGLSSGIGNGTSALSAIALGSGKEKTFHDLAYNAVILGIIAVFMITLSSGFLIPWLFTLSGASGEAYRLGVAYTEVIFYGSAFFVYNSIVNGLLNAQGDTKSYRNFLIIGFILNLILDPLFIFGWFNLPKLGTLGVALATVIIQGIGSVYLSWRLLKSYYFRWSDFMGCRPSKATILDLVKQGVPASLNIGTIAIGIFIINYFILRFAPGPVTIAAYGASMRIEQIALLPAMGLNIAVLTIAGQNYGAGKYHRIYDVKKISLYVGVIMMVVAAAIIYPFAPFLLSFFNSDSTVIQAGTAYLRIEAFALPTYVILNVLTSVLQGIKKPNFTVVIGLYRQIFMPIILFQGLAGMLNMGINGIWFSIVVINWSAVVLALGYTFYKMKKVLTPKG